MDKKSFDVDSLTTIFHGSCFPDVSRDTKMDKTLKNTRNRNFASKISARRSSSKVLSSFITRSWATKYIFLNVNTNFSLP